MSDPVTTWLPVPIRTGRVVVRPPDRGDEDAIVELFTDPEVRRFLGGPVEPEVAHARAAEIVSGATRGSS